MAQYIRELDVALYTELYALLNCPNNLPYFCC